MPIIREPGDFEEEPRRQFRTLEEIFKGLDLEEISPVLDNFRGNMPTGVLRHLSQAGLPDQERLEELDRVRQIGDLVTGRSLIPEDSEVIEIDRKAVTAEIPAISRMETLRVSAVTAVDPWEKAMYQTRNIRAIPIGLEKAAKIKTWWDFPLLVFLCAVVVIFSTLISGKPSFTPLQLYTTIVWSGYIIVAAVGIAGIVAGMFIKPLNFKGKVSDVVVFMVPSVVRFDVIPSLIGVIDSILTCAPSKFPNFLIQVVYNQGAEAIDHLKDHYAKYWPGDYNRILWTEQPKEFEDGYGTKKKCLANQYALLIRRYIGLVGHHVFTVHLDDDTKVTYQTIEAYANFVANQYPKYIAGQGPLTFAYQLGGQGLQGKFVTFMDSVRGGDDESRFKAALLLTHSPLFGFHGENLIMGTIEEDALGWNLGPTLVEDALFAMMAIAAYGNRFAYIQGATVGASPESIHDFIIQRARWCQGLVTLLFDDRIIWYRKILMGYAILNWVFGFLHHMIPVLFVALLIRNLNTSPVSGFFIYIWAVNYGFQMWTYVKGCVMNLKASQAQSWQYIILPVLVILSMITFAIFEAIAAGRGAFDALRGKTDFKVIKKSGGLVTRIIFWLLLLFFK